VADLVEASVRSLPLVAFLGQKIEERRHPHTEMTDQGRNSFRQFRWAGMHPYGLVTGFHSFKSVLPFESLLLQVA
jgi:hypothetical protein